jgi:hypothetical protein
MKYKYVGLIVSITIIIIFFYLLVSYGNSLIKHKVCDCKEGFAETNSPLYSHTVDLPLTKPLSCQNFCGPKSTCAITKTQCTSDIDCFGCQSPIKYRPPCQEINFKPYAYDMKDYEYIYPQEELQKGYEGIDQWTPSFNKGLELYNKKIDANYPLSKYEKMYQPNYQTRITATGTFYDTTPPASNSFS